MRQETYRTTKWTQHAHNFWSGNQMSELTNILGQLFIVHFNVTKKIPNSHSIDWFGFACHKWLLFFIRRMHLTCRLHIPAHNKYKTLQTKVNQPTRSHAPIGSTGARCVCVCACARALLDLHAVWMLSSEIAAFVRFFLRWRSPAPLSIKTIQLSR